MNLIQVLVRHRLNVTALLGCLTIFFSLSGFSQSSSESEILQATISGTGGTINGISEGPIELQEGQAVNVEMNPAEGETVTVTISATCNARIEVQANVKATGPGGVSTTGEWLDKGTSASFRKSKPKPSEDDDDDDDDQGGDGATEEVDYSIRLKALSEEDLDEEASEPQNTSGGGGGPVIDSSSGGASCCSASLDCTPGIQDNVEIDKPLDVGIIARYRIPLGGRIGEGEKYQRSFGTFLFTRDLNVSAPLSVAASGGLIFVPGELQLQNEISSGKYTTNLYIYTLQDDSGKIVIRQYAIADAALVSTNTAVPLIRYEISHHVSSPDPDYIAFGRHFSFKRYVGNATIPYNTDRYIATSDIAGRETSWLLNNGANRESNIKTIVSYTPSSGNGYLYKTITTQSEVSSTRNGLLYPVSYTKSEYDLFKRTPESSYSLRLNSCITGVGKSREKRLYEYGTATSLIQTKVYKDADTPSEYLSDYTADFDGGRSGHKFTIRPWLDTLPESLTGLRIREDYRLNTTNDVTLFTPGSASEGDPRFWVDTSPDKLVLYQKAEVGGGLGTPFNSRRTIYQTKGIFGYPEGETNWRQYAVDEHLVADGFDGSPLIPGSTRPGMLVSKGIARRIERSGRTQEYSLETLFTPSSALAAIYPSSGGPYKTSHVISDSRVSVGSSTFSPSGSYQQAFQSTRILTVRGRYGPVTEERQVWNGTDWITMSARQYFYAATGNKLSSITAGRTLATATDVVELHEYPNDNVEQITDSQGLVSLQVKGALGQILQETRKGAPATATWPAQPDIVTTYTESPITDPAATGTVKYINHLQTTVAGALTRVESRVDDLDNATVSSTDVSGVVAAYSSGLENGHVTDTVSFAAGAKTFKSSRHLDGQRQSESGTGQVKKVFTYAVKTTAPKGIEETETTLDGTTPVSVVKRLKAGNGEILSETVNGITTTFGYDVCGRIISKSTPKEGGGNRVYRYNYDYRDLVTQEGYDLNGDGALTVGATDTLIQRERYYELSGTHWWLVSKDIRYLENGSSTLKQVTTTREKQGTGASRVVEVTYPNGSVETETTTVSGKVVTRNTVHTAYPGRTKTEITYNGRLVSSQSYEQTKPVIYSYDALGRVTGTTDQGTTESQTTVYDGVSDRQSTVQNSEGETTHYEYYPSTHANAGRLHWMETPNGKKIYYAYNLFGQVTHQWGNGTQPLRYHYNGAGRLTDLDTFNTNNPSDWSGATLPYAFGASTAYRRRHFDLTDGRLTSRTFGPLTQDGGVGYTYSSADGLISSRTWSGTASGPVSTYSHDAAGRRNGIDYGDSTPDVGATYDRAGRVKTRTDAGGTHTFTYDTNGGVEETVSGGLLNGLLLKKTVNTAGHVTGIEWSFAGQSQKAAYGYDGQMRLETASLGPVSGSPLVTATYGYHPDSNRVKTVTRPIAGGQPLVGTQMVDSLGRIDTLVWQRGTTAYGSYDYGLDTAGRRQTETRLDGTRLEYGYNDRGELTSTVRKRADNSTREDWTHGYTYGDDGSRLFTATPEGENWWNGNFFSTGELLTTSLYKHWLRGKAHPQAVVTVNGQTATREGDTWRYLLTNSFSNRSQTANVQATRPDLSPAPPAQNSSIKLAPSPASYFFDSRGNLTSDARWTYTWDAENRLIMQEEKYIPVDSISTVRRLEFGYDALGRRISKRVSLGSRLSNGNLAGSWTFSYKTVYLWQDWTLLAEFTHVTDELSALRLRRSYLWGLDVDGSFGGAGGVGGLLWVADYDSYASAPLSHRQLAPWYDGNGNIMGWIENEGAQMLPLYRREYDPYGNVLEDEVVRVVRTKKQRDLNVDPRWLDRPPFGFSTKYEDSESGMLYYGYRYYQPQLGRWISRDPIWENGGSNLITMAGNDPINFVDSDGRAPMNGGVGGPQILPPGGYPPPPKYPGTNYGNGNIEELLAKVDSEGQAGPQCPECNVKLIRDFKKKLLIAAHKWNQTSKPWAKYQNPACIGNECNTQAQSLVEFLNDAKNELRIMPGAKDPLWYFMEMGGSSMPVFKEIFTHNVTGVYYNFEYIKKDCGFKDFYIDPFKGKNGGNAEGRIGSGPQDEFNFFYPYEAFWN